MRVVRGGPRPLYEDDTVSRTSRRSSRAIPGLELVRDRTSTSTATSAPASSCQSVQRAALDEAISETRRVEADALVSVYHGCHRFLVKRAIEGGEPFEVVNWVSLLGRVAGREVKDRYRAFALLGDEDLILEEALALDAGQGIPLDRPAPAIAWEFGSGAGAAKPW